MKRTLLLPIILLALALVPIGCDDDDGDNGELLGATLTGAGEVPPVNTTGTGTAIFSVQGTSVTFRVDVAGLTGVAAAHIHLAPAGSNGPVVVILFSGPTTGTITGTLAQGTFSASNVSGMTFDALLAAMRSGGTYVNVHTVAHPAGEIRGQVAVR